MFWIFYGIFKNVANPNRLTQDSLSLLEPVIDLGLGSVIDVVILVVPAKSIPRVNISNFKGTELDKKEHVRAVLRGKNILGP